MREERLRAEVRRLGRRLLALGLVAGSAGNVSLRDPESGVVAISPSARPWEELREDEVAVLEADGRQVAGLPASREKPLHLALYRRRPEVTAVVHTHSPAVLSLAILRESLPPVLAEMALLVGGEVPCAPFRPPGSIELGEAVAATIGSGPASIMANHGAVSVGRDGKEALEVARLLEETAAAYLRARCAGRPVPLGPAELG